MIFVPVWWRGLLVAHAVLDAQDSRQAAYYWRLHSAGYAERKGGVRLHRAVLGLVPGDGLQADHINGDRLDCRRSNLRATTHQQNCQNRTAPTGGASSERGVSWHAGGRKWRARVTLLNQEHHLGLFDTEQAAASAARAFRARHLPFSHEAPR